MRELWADVEDYESYMVSDHGRVRNWKTGLEMTVRTYSFTGYSFVFLSRGGRKKQDSAMIYVHDLVARTFTDCIPEGKIPVHVDGDKTNNHIDNLRWAIPTPEQKNEIVFVEGANPTKRVGLIKIVETGEVFRGLAACAMHIGGSAGAISDCLNGKRHSHKGYTFSRTGIVA